MMGWYFRWSCASSTWAGAVQATDPRIACTDSQEQAHRRLPQKWVRVGPEEAAEYEIYSPAEQFFHYVGAKLSILDALGNVDRGDALVCLVGRYRLADDAEEAYDRIAEGIGLHRADDFAPEGMDVTLASALRAEGVPTAPSSTELEPGDPRFGEESVLGMRAGSSVSSAESEALIGDLDDDEDIGGDRPGG